MLSGQNNNKTLLIHWLHLNNEFVNAFCLMLMCGFITSVCLSGCHCARKRATITGTSKRFQLGISMRGGINGWGKRVGKDGESLQNFPPSTAAEPQMQLFLHWGSDHKVSTVLIRWNKRGCNPHSDQRHWSTCHTPLPLSSCTNLSEGKLTDPATRAGRGGGVEGGLEDPVWVLDRGKDGWRDGLRKEQRD